MYEEEKLQQMKMQAEAAKCAQSGQSGTAACSNEPCRVGLRERVSAQLFHSRREAYKTVRLDELNHLLDKNPEVARILDLIEDVRG